jgi:hypothetical protein
VQLESEPSAFSNASPKQPGLFDDDDDEIHLATYIGPDLIVAVYVDDLMIVARTKGIIEDFKRSLIKRFDIKDFGEATDYLGIEIDRNREKGTLKISQGKYFEGVLKRYKLNNCNPKPIPLSESLRINVFDEDFLSELQKFDYQSRVKNCTFGMQGTRPDIAFPISILSRFLARPTRAQYQALDGVLRYISGSIGLGIVYNKHDKKGLHAYSDADWAGPLLNGDSRSTSGYAVFFAGGLISWCSKRQTSPALSSTNSEYVAQGLLLRHIAHLLSFLSELLMPPTLPIRIYADNQGAQALAKNPVFHGRSKHIPLTWHAQRHMVDREEVEMVHTPTKYQAADGFTKPLNKEKFERFKELLKLE